MKLFKKIVIFSFFIILCCAGLFALIHKNADVRNKIIEYAEKNDLPQIKGYLSRIQSAGNRIEKTIQKKEPFQKPVENDVKRKEPEKQVVKNTTQKRDTESGDSMFYWIDENGIKHYSDKPPEDDKVLNSWKKEKSKNKLTGSESNSFKETTEIYQDIIASKKPEKAEDSIQKNQLKKQQQNEPGFKKISSGLFEVNGYQVELSGHCSGGILRIRGRVSGGKTCKELKISASLKSRKGAGASASFTAKNIGPGKSDTLRADKSCSSNNPTTSYEVTNISISRIY